MLLPSDIFLSDSSCDFSFLSISSAFCGWLVGHQNKTSFPLRLIYELMCTPDSLEGQTIPVEVQCPPSPRPSSSAHSTFSSAPETHILQTLLQTKENFQLQQKVFIRPRQHKGKEGRGSRLSRWERSSPPSCRPGSETSRSAPRCSCAEIWESRFNSSYLIVIVFVITLQGPGCLEKSCACNWCFHDKL